ncbi:MAG: DUF2178 domain-containing protein [archaeon]|nr:DUF2178 domain-containing protein [archaeon]
MNPTVKVIIMSAISVLCTILGIIGIITTDILYYIIALILTCIKLPLVYKNRDNLDSFFSKRNGKTIEDERTKLLDGKASNATLGITIALIINIVVVILILRNVYPFLMSTAIILIVILIISLISYVITKNIIVKKDKYL